jgi:hypothetical protein
LPASPALSSNAVDAALPAAASTSAPKGCPVSRAWLPQALSARHEPGALTSRLPLSPLPASSGIPDSVGLGQDRFHAPPAKAAHAVATREAFRRQVPSPSALACARTAATGPPLVPRFGHRGPASDMLSRSASLGARPEPLAGFHRSALATCRLPTSATERPPSTPTNRPNLVARCSGEPLRDRVVCPLRGVDPPSFLRSGVAPALACSTPTTTTACRSGFTPT